MPRYFAKVSNPFGVNGGFDEREAVTILENTVSSRNLDSCMMIWNTCPDRKWSGKDFSEILDIFKKRASADKIPAKDIDCFSQYQALWDTRDKARRAW
jgi:hypothetical protein